MGKVSQRLLKQFEEQLIWGDESLGDPSSEMQYEREVTEALGRN